MTDRERILNSLEHYILKSYRGPFVYRMQWGCREVFEQVSYSKWAAKEFLEYLKTSEENLYISAETFVRKMDDLACEGKKRNRWIFSVAYDVAVDLQSYLYSLR